MKRISAVFFLTCFSLVVYAQQKLFNDGWQFHKGDITNYQTNGADTVKWRTVNLPHDWSIEGKIDRKNPTGKDGGYFPAGVAWYRKTFKVPEEWEGKNVSIYFFRQER